MKFNDHIEGKFCKDDDKNDDQLKKRIYYMIKIVRIELQELDNDIFLTPGVDTEKENLPENMDQEKKGVLHGMKHQFRH